MKHIYMSRKPMLQVTLESRWYINSLTTCCIGFTVSALITNVLN